ncbi:DUF5986 family protein [Bacillus sp. DJP31]|uniref:DUF5986 family protein n=1 Tax=Bacillus sp. DJP31 TaxID=3409789 RepID=UPI003BB66085
MDILKDSNHIKSIVKCFTDDTTAIRNEIALEYRLPTGNFRNFMVWDIIFGRLADKLCKEEFEIVELKRGNWTFNAPLHKSTGTLYLFTKEANLKRVEKKLTIKKPHYFYSLSSINGDLDIDAGQLSLKDLYDEDSLIYLTRDAIKILGDAYSKVRQVLIVVGIEKYKKMTDVSVHLYNQNFELCDSVNWSEYISNIDYEDILPSTAAAIEDNATTIVKLKKKIEKPDLSIAKLKKEKVNVQKDNEGTM